MHAFCVTLAVLSTRKPTPWNHPPPRQKRQAAAGLRGRSRFPPHPSPTHKPGRDGFHSVPNLLVEEWDAVERVPTRFMSAIREPWLVFPLPSDGRAKVRATACEGAPPTRPSGGARLLTSRGQGSSDVRLASTMSLEERGCVRSTSRSAWI